MKVAAVDIGTNSTRLLIAESNGEAIIEELERRTVITRLGRGLGRLGHISDDVLKHTLQVLSEYAAALAEYEVQAIRAVATSAMRDADNSEKVLDAMEAALGARPSIIPGKTEAELTYSGVLSDRETVRLGALFVAIDIGGGSTEIVYGNRKGVRLAKSLPLGCVRQTEAFLKTDPPAAGDVAALRAFTAKTLKARLAGDFARGAVALAVAGTATSLAAIEMGLDTYDRDKVHRYRLAKVTVSALLNKLASLTNDERKTIMALEPERADSIVAGAAILLEIMNYFRFEEVLVSERDILDGVALSATGALSRP